MTSRITEPGTVNKMKNHDCAILVLSCDKYADIWPTFYDFFFKYWPDCPFKIYHSSNFLKYDHPNITNLHSNQISDWSTETKSILGQIEEKYLITILDDYFIYKAVDIDLLRECVEFMKMQHGIYFRIGCMPSKFNFLWQYQRTSENPRFGKIKNGQSYKINLQISIWERDAFCNLIKEGESAWDFEINGSKRADSAEGNFYCLVEDKSINYVHGPITYFCTALSKGVWMRDAIKLCKKENIPINLSSRRTENTFEYLFRKFYIWSPIFMRKYLDFIRKRILFTFIKV